MQQTGSNKGRMYWYLLGAGLLFLGAFVLFGPAKEEDKKKAYLWKQNWEKIVYQTLNKESIQNSSQSPEKEILFYRRGGLTKDLFYVEAPLSQNHSRPKRRLANAQVSNLFRDWRKPEDRGLYALTSKLKELAGLGNPIARVEFYSDADSTSPTAYILVGQKQKNGNYFVEIHEGPDPPVMALLNGFYINKFLYDLNRYRERRFLFYPAGSYLADFQISIQSSKKQREVLHLVQEQSKEEKRVVTKFYRFGGDTKTEIPPNLAQSLIGSIKQIQIRRFADEKEMQNLALSSWPEESPLAINLRIENSKGDVFEARLAEIAIKKSDPHTAKLQNSLAYFQNRNLPFIDFADKNLSDKIAEQTQAILGYKAQASGAKPSSAKSQKK